ncbi:MULTISPECIES: hypothetical protein [unclassified Campylobacter]|uniref:hypothetical protein n=1 Tax=unclassified Campylobacter TaxID=2593542 RepID=UPI001237C4B3|nr:MULTISPECIES: hypothetical protein [unclassified Campylobacter]KAA6225274.1 hypothetical protein FMM57_07790 [Campylobacter sp. LR286c]KAA6226709.1 hypothetical protein FMM55_03910 [Campylobacter sp. LR196d]KAA6227665.1 hypothetical protein FMM54_02465 [Campylobacter sp. LR185c]KAA6233915.1 hypothetical protein FMM58_01555 [Campylobacter sp. LR291e]KAA8604805.1 hypothetical protein CGP82_00025 [Campylobacter sp. LR185c]
MVSEGSYLNDNPDGLINAYVNGVKRREFQRRGDRNVGIAKVYDEFGNLNLELDYDNVTNNFVNYKKFSPEGNITSQGRVSVLGYLRDDINSITPKDRQFLPNQRSNRR